MRARAPPPVARRLRCPDSGWIERVRRQPERPRHEASSTPPAPGVLWAVRNGPGALFRLVWNGTIWTPDLANSWGAGKVLHHANGTGNTDAEGVTFAGHVQAAASTSPPSATTT